MTAPSVRTAALRRLDADGKVTGRARYASDYAPAGMLYGKIVRSDRPAARIVSIDTSAAEELPGVWAVLSRRRLVAAIRRGGQRSARFRRRQGALRRRADCGDRRRNAGDRRNGGVADRSRIRGPAVGVRSVKQRWTRMRPWSTTTSAICPVRRMLIREGNICAKVTLKRGNVDAAFTIGASCGRGPLFDPFGASIADGDPRRGDRARRHRPVGGACQHAASVRGAATARRGAGNRAWRCARDHRNGRRRVRLQAGSRGRDVRRAADQSDRPTGAHGQHPRGRFPLRGAAPSDDRRASRARSMPTAAFSRARAGSSWIRAPTPSAARCWWPRRHCWRPARTTSSISISTRWRSIPTIRRSAPIADRPDRR